MTNRMVQHVTEGEGIITLRSLEAAIDAIQRRGDVRQGGMNGWMGAIIRWWDKPCKVLNGTVPKVAMGGEEMLWLMNCWQTATSMLPNDPE